MAKKKKEEPKVDNEVGSLKVKEKPNTEPTEKETKGDVTKVKEKMKMKPIIEEETIVKVDLNKPPSPDEQIETTDKETVEEVDPEKPIIEEITEEEIKKVKEINETASVVEKAITESIEKGEKLPEDVQKLMNFMDDTGGSLADYVNLNKDYSEMDNHTLLKEYYKSTKTHLEEDEVNFLMEDKFSYDEEVDSEKEIKRKKLALKEQVASAKKHLDGLKSKYYKEIKAGSRLTPEAKKAVDFFNRYKQDSVEQQKEHEQQHKTFLNKTNQVFTDDFKGFEYSVGEKKFRFNVKDSGKIKKEQSDINNFVRKFLDKNNEINDAKGYHKGLFTAMNADTIANHFYEQGKADALKNSVAKSKNIDMDPRQQHSGEIDTGGVKVRVLGDNSSDYKFKIKHK